MSRKTETPFSLKKELGPNVLKVIPAGANATDKAWQEVSSILNNICEVVFKLDALASYIDVHDGITGLAGYTPEEMRGRSVFEFLHPDEHEMIASVISENLHTGSVVKNLRHRFRHKNGYWIWLNTSGQSQRNEEGLPAAIIGVSYDITKNVIDEENLKAQQEKYSRLFFSHPLPLLVFDLDTFEMLDVNVAAEKQYGYTREEFLTLSIKDIRPVQDVPAFVNKISRERRLIEETGDYLKGYWHHKKKNGELFFVEIDYYYLDFNGRSAGLASVKDITEKKHAQEQNRYLANIVDSTSDAIYTCDMDLNIISWNRAAEQVYGITAAEAIGKTLGLFLEPQYECGSREKVMQAVKEQGSWKGEVTFQRPTDQLEVTLLSSVTTLKNEVQQSVVYLITSKDISERKLAEKIITESETRFRLMADSAPVMIWVTNDKDETIYYNQGWLSFRGQSLEEEIGQRWEDKVHPDDVPHAVKEYYMSVAKHQPFTIEYRLGKSDGSYNWVIDRGTPRFLEDGRFMGYSGVCFNIQDRREVESRLLNIEVEKQKLITAAGIKGQEKEREEIGRELHDNVNQLISSAKLYMEVVKRDPVENSDLIGRSIDTLNLAIQEIRRLSKNLNPPSLGNLGINEAIEELIEDVHLSSKLLISFSPCREAEKFIGAEVALTVYRMVQEQVNNILKHSEARDAAISLAIEQGRLLLTISDNGKGFDTSLRRKGVGLTNIANRSQLHDGAVSVISSPGKGCTLKVSIPVP